MTVYVTREAEPQFELYGAYDGELLGGGIHTTASATFTATADYLIVVPKNSLRMPQVELGATPSSYIPTSGASATRAADTLTIPAANMPWNPLAVSIAMEGRMTGGSHTLARWYADANNNTILSAGVSDFTFTQEASGTVDSVTGGSFTSGTLVPFNIASRHGSTFVNGAVDGTALTADLTPVALPDLSATDLLLGYDFMGTIKSFRVWADDLGDTGIAEASA